MLRNILLVSSGGLIAQAINMAAIVALSRMYDPEAFGLLGTFSATVLILTAFACGKFDLAAVIANSNGRSSLFVMAGLAVTGLIVLISLVGVVVISPFLSGDGVFARLEPYFWLIPFFVLAFGLQLMMSQILVRRGEFQTISTARIAQAAGANGLQMALFGFGAAGLLLGYVAGFVIAALVLLRKASRDRFYLRARLGTVFYAARDRLDFAVSASIAGALNIAAIQLPLILCAMFFSAVDTGFLTLSQRSLGLPAALLGLSVSQVFLYDLRRDANLSSRRATAVSTYNILLSVGVPPTVFLMVYGTQLFGVLFGSEWEESGRISSLFGPFLMSIILSTPFLNVFYVLERPRIILCYTAFSVFCRFFAFSLPAWLGYSFDIALVFLAVISFVPNAVLVLLALRLLGCSMMRFLTHVLVSILWALVLIMPGLAFSYWNGFPTYGILSMIMSAIAIMTYMILVARKTLRER